MSPSEKFKNMAEVKEYVESMRGQVSDEDFELFQYLFGLLENRGFAVPVEINGEEVQIDKSIAPMIEDLIDKSSNVQHKVSSFTLTIDESII